MDGSMKKYVAEVIGTAALVIIGCCVVTLGGQGAVFGSGQPLSALATLPIAFAFGLAIVAMACGIGPVSGGHVNPAVTVGVWMAGRMPGSEVPGYIAGQVLGAIAGGAISSSSCRRSRPRQPARCSRRKSSKPDASEREDPPSRCRNGGSRNRTGLLGGGADGPRDYPETQRQMRTRRGSGPQGVSTQRRSIQQVGATG